MKLYTRRGDQGATGLFGGGRVRKDDMRVEALGTVDELNAAIGVAVCHLADSETRDRLGRVQADLFVLGAHLAAPPPKGKRTPPSLPALPAQRVPQMESWIDEASSETPPLDNFVLPGGGPGGSRLHAARAVCRRAERRVVALAMEPHHESDAPPPADPEILRYLNRLSDYLFAAARLENARSGGKDAIWRSNG